MPLLKAKKALNELAAGELLRVVSTDPGSVRDFQVFAEQSGHALVESRVKNGRYHYLLEKKGLLEKKELLEKKGLLEKQGR